MQEMSKGVFVSQVGKQPAAVAVAAAALARTEKIQRVVLLATDHTQAHAQRLQAYLAGQFPSLTFTVVPFNAAHDVQAFAGFIRTQADSEPGQRFYLNISGGFSFFWASVSRFLQGMSTVWPVFAEREKLYLIGSEIAWELKDLGLSELLSLYGLKGAWDSPAVPGPVENFRLLDAHGQTAFSADLAFERNGHLFVLLKDIEGRERARRVLAVLKGSSGLNGLQPQVTAVTRDIFAFWRLKAAGIDVIRLGGKQGEIGEGLLKQWKRCAPSQPGRSLPIPLAQLKNPSAMPHRGGGGDGPPLLVCLGNDPSTTVAAICSQRPEKAWVLYDESTPLVTYLATKIAECAADLPITELWLVPVGAGYRGNGIDGVLLQRLGVQDAVIYGNVTPGSKPQSWMFGQLAGLRLVSINTGANPPCIESCDEGERIALDLDPGQGIVLGRILGGGGARVRLSNIDVRDRLVFLTTLARSISLFSDANGNFSLTSKNGAERIQFDRKSGKKLAASWRDGKFAVEIKTGFSVCRGELAAPMEKGRIMGTWLEEVTAGAFMAAGARDVCVGLEWPWGAMRKEDNHRTEIDVVFSWQNTHAVVSVKADPLRKQDEVEAKGDEIRAMARECFGRFSLPILVYYAPRAMANVDAALESMATGGALHLPATLLGRPDLLRTILNRAMAQLRKG